ncbi:MAG: class B sortase [Clostridia bacterium]|nr:class B sortase [Clostridia bacterium]
MSKPTVTPSSSSAAPAVSSSSAAVPYSRTLASAFGQAYAHGSFQQAYAKAKAENSDTMGWLFVPGTTINLAVTQGKDNAYYLKHGLNKQYKWKGNPFLDYSDTLSPMSQNMIIYGHNMGDGDLFGQLKKYRQLDFLHKYPVIYFGIGGEDYYWKIFSVYITDVSFHYNVSSFVDDTAFESLIAQCTARSFFKTAVDVTGQDTILTLSTCTYEFHNARFVVMARLLREQENEALWDLPAGTNPDPVGPHGK